MLRSTCHIVCLLACVAGSVRADDAAVDPARMEFFENRIRPVLVERCYRCHSEEAAGKNQLKGGLLLDSRDGVLTGGDSGPAITAGNPDESLLLESLRYESYEMPPDGKLPQHIIDDFALWIEQGAVDPRTGTTALPARVIDLEAGRQHWAYRPLQVPPLTDVPLPSRERDRFRASARNQGEGATAGDAPNLAGAAATSPIDAFINAKLIDADLTPLPAADRVTLARRLSFDLTGLPPSPDDIDAFVTDDSPQAYERYVDRLLASPRFGERWGRHWLDVARFAESVTLRGLVQHEAWRYRDYVIESFNSDLPFNEFIRQQVAGDLLPTDSLEQARRQHIATTFLTLTNANLEDQDKEKLRMDVVDEQLTVIGQALLGQTIGCARCHDHKFDPIPTRDYYALAGILRSTKTMQHANVSRWIERPLPLPDELQQQVAEHEAQIAKLESRVAALKKQSGPARRAVAKDSLPGIVFDDMQATFVGQWKTSASVKPYVDAGYQHDENSGRGEKSATWEVPLPRTGEWEVRLSYTPGTNRSSRVLVTVHTADGEHEATINQKQTPPIDGLFVSLGRHTFAEEQPAVVVISNEGADGHVIADAVQFLPVDGEQLAKTPTQSAAEKAERQEQRERQQQIRKLEAQVKKLQQSLPPRPLYQGVEEEAEIADMHVNIRGNVHQLGELVPRGFLSVVSTGTDSEIPADESGRRQLGEWLADPVNPLPARVYVNRVWQWLFGAGLVSTPDNFGMTGQPPSHPELLEYLAGRFVERGWSTKKLVREIVLSDAYRRLSTPSDAHAKVDPENRLLWRMNRKRLEAECLMDAVMTVSGTLDHTLGGKTLPEKLSADYDFEHDSNRRAIYWPLLRNAVPEMMLAFDGANPSLVTGRRNVSSVAPQALYLLNNPWILEQSELAAGRLLAGEALSDSARIQQAFRLTLGRLPTDAEEQTVTAFVAGSEAVSDEERLTRWTQVVQSLFGTLDFRYVY
jgi:cytochrome c553